MLSPSCNQEMEKSIMRTKIETNVRRPFFPASTAIAFIAMLLVGGYAQLTVAQQPKAFASASQAAQALYEAVKNNDEGAVRDIVGAGPELTSSGDQVVDKLEHEQFARKYEEMHRLVREPDGSVVLYIGAENWPFPIPLVATGSQWRFDPDAGAQEIAARRIGEDETTAIEVCRDLGRATQSNVGRVTGDNSALDFARKLAANDPAASQVFYGYKFRIGTEQSVGVVLVASPIEYGTSGVMTFVVVPGGAVYEKDLGPQTVTLAAQINARPSGTNWAPVQ
jgi:Protein of unknown function (DUF2950)